MTCPRPPSTRRNRMTRDSPPLAAPDRNAGGMPEPDLTIPEVAATVNAATETIARMVRRGALPGAYKIGNRWRVPREAVDRLRSGALTGSDDVRATG